ncbi:hypothetical protein Ciccas_005828 [Cichlidogyrus casuarinus]|uniref:Major facilitator superfamily (MFS) profile domain-containing protein n=1 Tax=Cichlidogyrus casuarinus TaxID=1844966 RepID=A0ABD2Q7J9_9PLAT
MRKGHRHYDTHPDLNPVESVIKHVVGPNGIWQWGITLLICLSTTSVTQFINFANAPVQRECIFSASENQTKCTLRVEPDQYPGSIIKQWKLVDERQFLVPLGTSIFMASTVLGHFFSGKFIDRFGRRFGLIFFSFFEMAFGFLVSISPSYWVYVILRAICGFASVGATTSAVILISELTTYKYRSYFTGMWEFLSTFLIRSAQCLLAHYIPEWRVLNAVCTVPRLLVIAYFWIPESPQWLASQGDTSKAIKVIHKAIRFNMMVKNRGLNLDEIHLSEDLQGSFRRRKSNGNTANVQSTNSSFKQIFKKLYFLFFLTSFIYGAQNLCSSGLLLYAPWLDTSIYFSSFLNAAMSVPSSLYFMFVYRKFSSRKWPLLFSFALASSLLLAGGCTVLFSNWTHKDLFLTISSNVAVCLLYATSSMLYVLVAETFSVEVKAQALGSSLAVAKLATIACSYINELDSTIHHGVPMLIYGASLAIATIFTFALPTSAPNL